MNSPTTKRTIKVCEFSAHKTDVTAVHIGRKSGQLCLTGSDKGKVKIWNISDTNYGPLMVLSGHKKSISTLLFDNNEEFVLAGSSSGSIKYWDCNSQKVLRSFNSHLSMVTHVSFSHQGDQFVSGSLDTNIKLWDKRSKSYSQTYKGHTQCVTRVSFTPDDQFIVSGSEDSLINVWDIRTGKILNTMKGHRGGITDFTFHPEESLIVSSSKDKTVKLWDFDSFKCVESTPITSSKVQHVIFEPKGKCVLAGAQDNIKVWGWEPRKNYDHIDGRWSDLVDMMIQSEYGQVLAASVSQRYVTVHSIFLNTLSPFGNPNVMDKPQLKNYMMHTASSTKNKAKRGHRSASVLGKQDYADRPHKSPTLAKYVKDDLDEMPKKKKVKSHLINTTYEKPLGLKPTDFIVSNAPYVYKQSNTSIIKNLISEHDEFVNVVEHRLKNYRTVRDLWNNGERIEAANALANLDDLNTTCEILQHIIKAHELRYLNLSICCVLLPLQKNLINSKNEDYVYCGLLTTKTLYQNFRTVITQTLNVDTNYAVDIARSSRQERCQRCRAEFLIILELVSQLRSPNSDIVDTAKHLKSMLTHLL